MDHFASFARPYFEDAPWADRVGRWLAGERGAFAAANAAAIRRILANEDTTARVVVNMGGAALESFLVSGKYLNAYERAVVGAKPPSDLRLRADARVGVSDDDYFAALSMGGAGIRYYGDYCMVLRLDIAGEEPDDEDADEGEAAGEATGLFDRDSYDTLYPPLDEASDGEIARLRGTWRDRHAMLLMRLLPMIDHDRQLVTSGTVIELALTDQEFIEVHLRDSFGPGDVDQVVESADTAAIEARIRQREESELAYHEIEWAHRRGQVAARLSDQRIRQRVVTSHGRGYQWK